MEREDGSGKKRGGVWLIKSVGLILFNRPKIDGGAVIFFPAFASPPSSFFSKSRGTVFSFFFFSFLFFSFFRREFFSIRVWTVQRVFTGTWNSRLYDYKKLYAASIACSVKKNSFYNRVQRIFIYYTISRGI